MVGCSAVNCHNTSNKGYQMFRFPNGPSKAARRAKWIQNGRRNWVPNKSARLCEVHFERTQFEVNPKSDVRRLKKDAIPTIFDVPNPPPKLSADDKKSIHRRSKTNESPTATINTPEEDEDKDKVYTYEEYQTLKRENESLKAELEKMKTSFKSFLNDEQIAHVVDGHKLFEKWEHPTIIKALKFRFALACHGYNFLYGTKYPFPCERTVYRRIRKFQIRFGIFEGILKYLQHKVDTLPIEDKFCALSIDEMEIDCRKDYDKNLKEFFGHVTLGNPEEEGTHVVSVLARGLKAPWKQIIAAEVTGTSTTHQDVETLVDKCTSYLQEKGLTVLSLTNDMGPKNQGFYKRMKVSIEKDGFRQNRFYPTCGGSVYCVADVCHLLKNLKHAVMRGNIRLPEFYRVRENLYSQYVDGKYVRSLWEAETRGKKDLRLLHHLKRKDIYPDNHDKMHVGAAMRFFSEKTAAALEIAVYVKLLPVEALTTANFIRRIRQWFSIVNSKYRKTSITRKNKEAKFTFLEQIIELFQSIRIGSGQTWKPLNRGMILSTLSIMDIVEYLLENGYNYVLTHRLSQDALENVFSQVRRRSSLKTSALQCLRALRMICLSQFISPVQRTNYSSDSDIFLLDSLNEESNKALVTRTVETVPSSISVEELPPELPTVCAVNCKLNMYDLNILYNIAGSTTRAISESVCENCCAFVNHLPETAKAFSKYKDALNFGGLKDPCDETFELLINCELLYRKFRKYLLHNNAYEMIRRIVAEVGVSFPLCCNVKLLIVNHFFTVRSFSIVSLSGWSNTKKMYGTSTAKKSNGVILKEASENGSSLKRRKRQSKDSENTSTPKKRKTDVFKPESRNATERKIDGRNDLGDERNREDNSC